MAAVGYINMHTYLKNVIYSEKAGLYLFNFGHWYAHIYMYIYKL